MRIRTLMRPVRVPQNKAENRDRSSFCIHLINNSEHLVRLHPSALCSSRPSVPQPLIVLSDFRLRSSFAAVLLSSLFFFRQCPARKNSHLPFFSGPQHYKLPTKKKKKTQFVFGSMSEMRGGGGGGKEALVKSPFEDGLKSAARETGCVGMFIHTGGFCFTGWEARP